MLGIKNHVSYAICIFVGFFLPVATHRHDTNEYIYTYACIISNSVVEEICNILHMEI
jgi:hypothetical protein